MRKILLTVALGALLIAGPGFALPAAASADWVFGAGFRLGGFHFSIGYYAGDRGPSDYYYRVPERVAYSGYECSDRCYHRGDYYYHHESCPVVAHHLARYRAERQDLFARYAPRYDGRYERYDSRYDGRYDDRYDRRYDDRYDRRRDDDRWQDRRYDSRYDRRSDRRYDRRSSRHDHRDHRGSSCPYGH